MKSTSSKSAKPLPASHPGRADVLRRALNKQKPPSSRKLNGEFFASALARGHSARRTAEVWDLVTGFAGYAFCKAHSTAYGVEAYQSAWLKRYYPAEFLAAVLTNGKGFYASAGLCSRMPSPRPAPLAPLHQQTRPRLRAPRLEAFASPLDPSPKDSPHTNRIPIVAAREAGPFKSLANFFHRVGPGRRVRSIRSASARSMNLARRRTRQFWQAQHLLRACGSGTQPRSKAGSSRLPASYCLPEFPSRADPS